MASRGASQIVQRRSLPNIVPSLFADSIHGTEPQDMALRDCNNNLWHLKIEKFIDGWHFTDGWVKFVEDNMIESGDVIFYQSCSEGVLNFKVMSPSTSEDGAVEHLKSKTMKLPIVKVEVKTEDVEAGADMVEKPPEKRDTEMVVDAGEAGTSSTGRKRKKQDYYGTEIFKPGGMQPPLNPYFVVDVRETRANEMHFPIDVIRDHKIQLPETLVLVDPKGRTFETKRRSWKDGRVNYNGGWKAVYRTNMLKTGDKLICEFIGNDGGVEDLHLKISFFIAT